LRERVGRKRGMGGVGSDGGKLARVGGGGVEEEEEEKEGGEGEKGEEDCSWSEL
jgi:hypothetical protein